MTRLEFDEAWLAEYQKRTGCRVIEHGAPPAGRGGSRQEGRPEGPTSGCRFRSEAQETGPRSCPPPAGRGGSRRTKYGNEPTIQDGKRYASKREARRARELRALRSAGEIAAFAEQVTFELPGGIRYVADFVLLTRDGAFTIEDSKGVRTKEYSLKKRLMAAQGLKIREV